jgi:hypothetical protein
MAQAPHVIELGCRADATPRLFEVHAVPRSIPVRLRSALSLNLLGALRSKATKLETVERQRA